MNFSNDASKSYDIIRTKIERKNEKENKTEKKKGEVQSLEISDLLNLKFFPLNFNERIDRVKKNKFSTTRKLIERNKEIVKL